MASSIQSIAPAVSGHLMQTGVPGLDIILGGGFLRGNSILLRGTPGAGKSALGMHLIANGALQFDEPAIILSFEQFSEHLYRDALSFGWDFHALEAQGRLRVIFARRDDLYSSFAEKESVAITQITDSTIDLRAQRVLIDSASQFWRIPLPQEEQRKIFFEFVMKLKGLGLTPILTSEAIGGHEDSFGPEEFAMDTILTLDHGPAPYMGGHRTRTLEVVKTRGQESIEGRHPFRIFSSGVRVSPCLHLEPPTVDEEGCPTGRRQTGVDDLDALLKGGFQAGTMTMIAGMTGTGKTTLAAHFIAAGLKNDEAGVYVSLHERPGQLTRNMDRRGLEFTRNTEAGRLTTIHAAATGLQPIEFRHTLEEVIRTKGATRVVIDGLRDLLLGAVSESEREYTLSLYNQLFTKYGVTVVCTWRVDDIAGMSSLASIPHASDFDNILYVGLVELQSRLRKVISVFKTRGEAAESDLRELIITPEDLRISDLFTGLSGILMGSASGYVPEAGQEILAPLMRIRDFVNEAQVSTPEAAQLVIENLRSEFNVLAQKIRRHLNLGEEPTQH
ncbi:MAG: ATPase domain-containing protein [Candidatus Sumerlaeaceae bacterium]